MHYFIDGYNLMFRLMEATGNFQFERELIIYDLHHKTELLNLDVTLVFDAQYRLGYGERSHLQHLEICFTDQGETADEYILNELKNSRTPKQETVVTSDKRLACKVRDYQVKTMSVEEFTSWISKPIKKKNIVKKAQPIVEQKVVDGELDFYLKEFEKRAGEQPKVEKPLTEFERWLKLFTEKLDHDD